MRIHWVRVKDFRGVAERRLDIPPRGVTIVEGPNEAGKSSLVDAIHILLEEMDSTSKAHVRSVQPEGRDVSTEIEAEFESGPYRFQYFKRFFRDRETRLKILRPRPENLAGRDAHDRVRKILDETMDLDLWDAMRVVQDAQPGEPVRLKEIHSLGQALDRAAGRQAEGERDATLVEAVREEYARYFSEGGKERKPLLDAAAAAEEARQRAQSLWERHEALQRDVEAGARLRGEVADLAQQAEQAAELERRRDAEFQALERRRDRLKQFELAAKTAGMEESAARKAKEEREGLIGKAREAERRRAQLAERAAQREPEVGEARERARSAQESLASVQEVARRAEGLARLRAEDFDHLHFRLDLDQLRERHGRIDAATREAVEARGFLLANRVTDDLLRSLRDAHLRLERARAQLEAGSSHLSIRALGRIEVEVDGERVALAPGETQERSVAERATVKIPGVAEVSVRAGAGTEGLVADRERASREFEAALDACGVPDLDAAEAANARRKECERVVAGTDARIKENLRNLTLQDMIGRIASLEESQRRYPERRPAEPPLPPDYDAAKEARAKARAEADAAQAALAGAQALFSAADAKRQELEKMLHEAAFEMRQAAEGERRANAELKAARDRLGDEAIDLSFAKAEKKAGDARAEFDRERRELEAANPEQVRLLAVNARNAAALAQSRLRKAQDEQREVSARLTVLGAEGLFEKLEEALANAEHAEEEIRSVRTRAAAARLLHEIMIAKREAARRAYAAPLRGKIIELGRLVFGDSLDVELDEDLGIARRTLQGRTLAFHNLSVGAREQLALIARVACGLLVDDKDGVPIIFDDTLGHSDPVRLEGLGAMLSMAGERCQILVLTCTPGRFRHVGGATLVQFR